MGVILKVFEQFKLRKMVCSFFYRTIPVLFALLIYWIYCKVTGKDMEPQVEENDKGEKKEYTGGCPYHMMLAMLGFPRSWYMPKEKQDGTRSKKEENTTELLTQGDKTVKVE